MWRKGNPLALLLRMWIDRVTMENSKEISLKNKSGYSTNNPTTGHIPWENHSKIHTYPVIHCSTIYNSQDMETIYPLTDECIKNWWYIYSMRYLLLFSHTIMSNSLWPHRLQHARPTFTHPLPSFAQIHVSNANMPSMMPSRYLTLWCSLLLLPSIFPSIKDFSNDLTVCIRWPKYWSFSFSISPSTEYRGLIFL